MRIVHLSYARIRDYDNPEDWLKRINFFVALLEEMGKVTEVISIHCIGYSGALKRNGVDYYFFKRNKFQLFIPITLNSYIKKLDPKVVVVHGIHFPWQVLWLRWQVGWAVKIIIQHHSEKPFIGHKRTLQRFADRFVSGYFFPSLDQARPWVEQRQISDLKKVYEIMEVPSVFYPIDKLEAKCQTQVNSKKTYLWVGRFDRNKDPITLINAFIKFIESNSDASLYVVYQRNELIDEVREILQSSPLAAAKIILVGKVAHDELLYWFNSADFIISTSYYEGMGVSVCEAMSCGCIPILTNIPSFRMMTKNQEFGLLFEAGDTAGLVLALKKSLSMDLVEQREKVLRYYKENLSTEAISAKMILVSKELLAAGTNKNLKTNHIR